MQNYHSIRRPRDRKAKFVALNTATATSVGDCSVIYVFHHIEKTEISLWCNLLSKERPIEQELSPLEGPAHLQDRKVSTSS